MAPEWIVTEIDGQIASISARYGHFAEIAAKVAELPPKSVGYISTHKITTDVPTRQLIIVLMTM